MALPDVVRRRVESELGQYCESRVPAFARHQVRLEYEIRGDSATIVERRIPWQPVSPEEPWTRFPIAQFRFDRVRRN